MRIGVAGVGKLGEFHTNLLKQIATESPDVEFAGVFDLNPERLQEIGVLKTMGAMPGDIFLLGNTAFNKFILAISVGAVFFGANTYIGNGPNFMVKAIAEQQKVHTPTFVGYVVRFALPFMLPMIGLVWFLFFR